MLLTAPAHDPALLRDAMSGEVVAPGEAGWDEARQGWQRAVDQRPAVIAVPETIADVQVAVGYARERGMAIAVQSTGHQAAAIASLEGSLLIRTHKLRGVKIDPKAGRAIVRAGDVWEDVSGPAAAHGLAPLAGSAGDVGVIGYTLGGGVSWLGRRYGLAANSVTAIAVVLADGRLVRADREHHADLFWALRGGGGAIGVVVALEMQLYEVSELTAGALFFPSERTAEVGRAWRDWARTLPEVTTTTPHVVQLPPFPSVPEPLRGRSFVTVELAHLGGAEEAGRLLGPIRALGAEIDTVAPTSPAALKHLHMDPPGPVSGVGDHRLLGELPHEAIDVFAALTDAESGSPLVTAEIRYFGGALGRRPEGHGALGAVPGEYMIFAAGMVFDEDSAVAAHTHLGKLMDGFEPYDSGHVYTNFVDRPTAASAAFDEATYARLREIKAERDPENLFRISRAID